MDCKKPTSYGLDSENAEKSVIDSSTDLTHLNVHSLQQRIWIANHIIQLKHTVRLKIKNVL